MAKEKTANVITIDDKQYTEDQLTDHQKTLITHLSSLDQKIGAAKFNLDQLSVGRQAFADALAKSLKEEAEAA